MERDPAWAEHTVTGTVVRNLDSADAGESPNITVWVEYEVDGTVYRHRERVRTRFVPTGRGIGGHGFKEQTVLPCSRGSELVVCYDPDNPRRAYLRDNVLTPEERAHKRAVVRRSLRVVLSIILGFVVLACAALAFAFSVNGSAVVAAVAAALALAAVILLAVIIFGLRTPGPGRGDRGAPYS